MLRRRCSARPLGHVSDRSRTCYASAVPTWFWLVLIPPVMVLGRAWLKRIDGKREAFRRRVVQECDRTDLPVVYRYGIYTITVGREQATVSDGVPETFSYSSVYMVSYQQVPRSGVAWIAHCLSGESSRRIRLVSFGPGDGELAMRVIAHRAGVPCERLD